VGEEFKSLSDEDWCAVLRRSIENSVIDGTEFPSFVPPSVQAQFVGSSGVESLNEALPFYKLVKGYAQALGMPINHQSKMLDFGCGWGRFLRFFWRDFQPDHLYGVDTDPDILRACVSTGVQAHFHRLEPHGTLPFPDSTFSHIIAYSVFTHLPEHIHLHWMAELSRVARPGCVFICTVEPRRFIDFIASIPHDAPSGWHAGLRRTAGSTDTLLQAFDSGNYVFIPTGGGDFRDPSVYGDAVIPLTYIKDRWTDFFELRSYIDQPSQFWQAVVVSQRW